VLLYQPHMANINVEKQNIACVTGRRGFYTNILYNYLKYGHVVSRNCRQKQPLF